MSKRDKDDSLNELNSLWQLLLPELTLFKDLVKDMAKIASPYQKDFKHIRTLINIENNMAKSPDIEKIITVIMGELNQFSVILGDIGKDSHVSELYARDGLLERFVNLEERMGKKLEGLQ